MCTCVLANSKVQGAYASRLLQRAQISPDVASAQFSNFSHDYNTMLGDKYHYSKAVQMFHYREYIEPAVLHSTTLDAKVRGRGMVSGDHIWRL